MVSLKKLPIMLFGLSFKIRIAPDNVPKLTEGSKEQYIQHVDSVISAVFPSEHDNLVLRKLVKKYQAHSHLRKNIFACLFSVHNTISISRHDQDV